MEWTPPRIRLFRAVGLCQSQYDFAKTLGFAERTIGNAERGTCAPGLALRRALDQALEHASDLQRDRFLAALTSEDQSIASPAPGTMPATSPALGLTAAALLPTFPVTSGQALATPLADRRPILTAIGTGAVLPPLTRQTTGLREMVLNAAHSSTILHSAIDAPKIEDRTLDEARQDLSRLATDYIVKVSLHYILPELVILRDRLYLLLVRCGQRPDDARELNLLLGATCVLLASVSHDLAEPSAAMTQTRAALAFAECAGHAGLITWVYCTRASIASWSGSADDVLDHAQRARAVGLSGIGAVRLAGLEARALAQSGQHQQVVEVLRTAQSLSGPEGAQDALTPVFEIPDEQCIPQIAQALSTIQVRLRSKTYANLPAARDLDEAIHNFRAVVDNQERS